MSTSIDDQSDLAPEIMDSHQAAEMLGLSVEALRKRISRGTVDGFKSNGRWYVRNADVKNDIIALLRQQITVKDEQIQELHSMLAKAHQAALDATISALPAPKKPWWSLWGRPRKAVANTGSRDEEILGS